MQEELERINQWFVRGIAIVVSGLFCSIMIFIFTTFDQNQFYHDLDSSNISISDLMQQIGKNIWGTRVFDFITIFAIILLTIITVYNLTNFNTIQQPKPNKYRRFSE